jgi:hypothetical protein
MILSLLQVGMRFQGDEIWVTKTVLLLGWGLTSSDVAHLLTGQYQRFRKKSVLSSKSILKMETACSSEKPAAAYKTSRCQTIKNLNLNTHCPENRNTHKLVP